MTDAFETRALARARGSGSGKPVLPSAGGIGYYGHALVKPPAWTWQIPLYFFVGGLSGASAMVGFAALIAERVAPATAIATSRGVAASSLATLALSIAAAGAALSIVLLISDLGRPLRFLYMLRVAKWQSAMSVGVWALSAYQALLYPALLFRVVGMSSLALALSGGAALLGSIVATYTGVLIAATAIPVWCTHRALLPAHFGIVALGSATATLVALGHTTSALEWLLGLAAAGELLVGAWLEIRRHGAADRSLHAGASGALIRGSGVLSGPTALLLLVLGAPLGAAIAFLIGALGTRYAWMLAGRSSGNDPEAVLALDAHRTGERASAASAR